MGEALAAEVNATLGINKPLSDVLSAYCFKSNKALGFGLSCDPIVTCACIFADISDITINKAIDNNFTFVFSLVFILFFIYLFILIFH